MSSLDTWSWKIKTAKDLGWASNHGTSVRGVSTVNVMFDVGTISTYL